MNMLDPNLGRSTAHETNGRNGTDIFVRLGRLFPNRTVGFALLITYGSEVMSRGVCLRPPSTLAQ